MFNTLPTILRGIASFRNDRSARRLSAVSVVAGGYGGDMPEDQFEELLGSEGHGVRGTGTLIH